jgi:hypothetical protein
VLRDSIIKDKVIINCRRLGGVIVEAHETPEMSWIDNGSWDVIAGSGDRRRSYYADPRMEVMKDQPKL